MPLKVWYENLAGHRVYKLVEDTKHLTKEKMELILTQTVPKLGGRGDTVRVRKGVGRNKLLPQGLAVYASPENKEMFEEERRVNSPASKIQEGKAEGSIQTRTGEMTLKYLKSCHFEVGMKNNVKYELTSEIVRRQFLTRLGVFVPPHALKLPDEPITHWGEYWCEVTVNGLETVRIPMHVVNYEKPRTQKLKKRLQNQEQVEEEEEEKEEEGQRPRTEEPAKDGP
ncbi:hypothetical protein JZ751_000075 [Albula glossodonta]|uniref:Large ribosomal subunit protein bL9m n=1 Tax=Albula glossodonta TaxID=121402 RepID=A0A8T2PUV2_9TELE|nr:hypothetical protein JZ751_000075 [Albula glossodonta]